MKAEENQNYDRLEQAIIYSSRTTDKVSNIFKACLLGGQFMLMFSAFNSAQNLISLLFNQSNEKNLGIVSLLVLYLVYGIASIFSPNICAKFNPKYVMAFSSYGYSLYLGSGIIVTACSQESSTSGICSEGAIYTFVILASALCGLGASTLWVSQAWYITNISTPATKGLYFGIFWALMQSSQILGNLMGYFLVGESGLLYFLVLTAICVVSGTSFLLLPNVDIGVPEVKNFEEKLRGMWVLLTCTKMRPLLFYYAFAGSITAFYAGYLFKLVVSSLPADDSDKEVAQAAALVFIVLGVFEFLGGMISGYLSDRVNKFLIATGSTIMVELALVLSIICLYEESYPLCFVTAAIWGFADCISQNMCNIMTATLFPDKIEGFAIYRMVQGFAITFVMVMNIYIPQQIVFILIIAFIEICTNVSTAKLGVKSEK